MQLVLKDIATPSSIRIEPDQRVTQDQFYDFCMANPDLRIELTAEGEIVIMPPTGGETSYRNNELGAQLHNWARRDGRGRSFDSTSNTCCPMVLLCLRTLRGSSARASPFEP